VRLCQIFSLLNEDGWYIDFLPDYSDASVADAIRLGALGVRIVHDAPLRWLEREGPSLDAVMLCRLPVADQYLDMVRRHATHAQVLFDTVDLHFIREQRAAELTGMASLMRQASRSRTRERAMVARCDITLVVSESERDVLAREAPGAHIEVVSNIHVAHGRARDFHGRSGMLFVGGFGHPPNEDAVRWFAREVLPILRVADPSIVFHVVGDIDDASRRDIEREGVIVHGRVADLAPLHAKTLVSVAPLRFGAGVKGKVNQAMSYGLPVVLTTIAAEGMHLRNGVDVLIADEPRDMAAAILVLSRDELLWTRISDAAIESVQQHFSTDHARITLRRALSKTV
jgi:glycosyltransferase involved in cell wall biosynthesis